MDEKDLFLKKFEEKLKTKLDKDTLGKLSKGFSLDDENDTSLDYEQFRLESLPQGINKYEKLCSFSEKVLNIKADAKTTKKLNEDIYSAHLACTPGGVVSFAILSSIVFLILGLFIMLFSSSSIGIGFVIIGISMYFIMQKVPSLFAKRLKVKANDEIIIAIFYMVAFMRFNSNLELATNFAANYLNAPLSLDFKRILWQVENSEYSNIKQAFDKYLENWRDENLEFLEAIYLIESSLYESEEYRRLSLLDKSLDIILQGNYEKILNFAQELKGKVSTFNMLGVVLPILGLIILPLAASFGDPKSTWQIVFLLYNILFPVGVAYFGFMIIFNRPSSANSIKTPKNMKNLTNLQKFPLKLSKNKTVYLSPKYPAIFIFALFLFIGLLPLIINGLGLTKTLNSIFTTIFGSSSIFAHFQDYKTIDKGTSYSYGPYGTLPGLLSLFIPLSFAFGIGYYLKYKYKNLINLRNKTKKLEEQFPSATFQLGNRINEGISAELAFGAVAETMRGTEAGTFFSIIDRNVKFNGMSVKNAIFDPEKGAMVEYPSDLITSSMKILVNAIDRGPDITAKTLIDLSKYLTEIHMSSQRMKDLLAESLGSMKGQASFLAPIISGVVVSIVSLVTLIMGKLSTATSKLAQGNSSISGVSAVGFLGNSIPTYLFQSVVGIYIVMLISILIYMISNLENGEDPINTKFMLGTKLIGGLTKYSIVVALGIILFTTIGASILKTI